MLQARTVADATNASPADVDSREAGTLTTDLTVLQKPIRRCLFGSASSSLPGDVRVLSDEDLMARINDGEPRALEAIFDRHAAVAYSLAYRVCGRRAMAEDVVQDAFLSLWHRAASYDRGRASVRSWLLSVVHNRAIDTLRRGRASDARNAGEQQIRDGPAAPELTETEVERREEARHVRQALEDLPPEQRRVIELAYFEGLTHRQIAQLLEIPSGTGGTAPTKFHERWTTLSAGRPRGRSVAVSDAEVRGQNPISVTLPSCVATQTECALTASATGGLPNTMVPVTAGLLVFVIR